MSEEWKIQNDPMYAAGYNDALEWAANWITGTLDRRSEETVEFAKAHAMTIRAVKLPIQQQDFFDAVRNDPYMKPEVKAYWLAMEPKREEAG